MELIENTELRETYDKCKYAVKHWEYKFKKKNGRLPSKLDIKEASNDVKYAYKKYFQLKTAAIESSFKDIDAFNFDDEESLSELNINNDVNSIAETSESKSKDVISEELKVNTDKTWGTHLSISNKEVEKEIKPERKVLKSFSEKLFNSSKLSKRNPRKSLSFVSKRNESNNKNCFLSQPNILETKSQEVTNQHEKIDDDIILPNSLSSSTKMVIETEKVQISNLNIIDSIVNSKSSRSTNSNSLDLAWIQRVTLSAGPELLNEDAIQESSLFQNISKIDRNISRSDTKTDYSSDDVVDNSEDEDDFKHITKKRRTTSFVGVSKPQLDFKNILHKSNSAVNLGKPIQTDTNNTSSTSNVKDAPNVTNSSDEPKTEIVRKKSTRQRKTLVNLAENLSSDEEKEVDPFAGGSSDDSTFQLSSSFESNKIEVEKPKKKVRKRKSSDTKKHDTEDTENGKPTKGTKRKSRETKKKDTEESESVVQTYELEYNIKPRIKTVPRLKSISDTLKTCILEKEVEKLNSSKVKTKREQEKEKFEKKVASGNLNENYVRINLKKKVFIRGKKTMNFSKYKKQQWKAKKKALCGPDMDMGGCDGGTIKCFTCGEIGHFAKYCNAHKKGDGLLPKTAADDVTYTYPTLEEAAEMMKENKKLIIRKPKNDLTNNEEGEVKESDDDDDDGEEVELDSEDEFLLSETIKIEEVVAKMDVNQYVDNYVTVNSYYNLKEDGSLIDTPQEVYDVLKLFGHSSFRPGQEIAIMRILSGKSTLVTLSTGSGKSLCYQLPAYLYAKRENCISLIISPLVSLMEDQVTDIPHFLKACCLHTNQTKTQREKIRQTIMDGKINVLLISPESVVAGEKSSGFGSFLRKLPPIAFACIDEAHCLSQWSHNFRPSYLMVCHILRERLGVNIILGLTATATQATCDSIIDHIRIPDGRNGIINDKPLPDNLRLTVSKDVNRDLALLKLLSSERFKYLKSVIIYCTRREECERLAGFLRTTLRSESDVSYVNDKKRKRLDVQAEPYHAGMSSSRRKSVQKAFMSGQLRIVVATVAFGMGINKSDIRTVIHYNMPSSFESYVQEVGRAGRDGALAHCHLFLDAKGNDNNELKRHIYANTVDRPVIRKLLQKIFVKCSCKNNCPRHEVAIPIQEIVQALDVSEEIIATLLCYLELHKNRYIEVLSPAFTKSKIISYSGPMQIRKAAKDCPLLTMALAMYKKSADTNDNILEFPVIELASSIGWDSGICKHKLKNLEWITVNNQPKRSTLNVQFNNLGFRLLAPGNLTDSQLDEALDSLYEHVVLQEKTSVKQLYALSNAVTAAVELSYIKCLKDEVSEKETNLKRCIREYFSDAAALDKMKEPELKVIDEERISSDTRTLLLMYRDNVFTGKAVARIFFGIQSPNYPALIWGRCKYWRTHLGEDFHAICKIATREILQMRQGL